MLSCQKCGGSPKPRVGGAAGQESVALAELGQMEIPGKKIPRINKLWFRSLSKARLDVTCSYFCCAFVAPCSKLSVPSCGAGVDFLCLVEGGRTAVLAGDEPLSVLPQTQHLGNCLAPFVHTGQYPPVCCWGDPTTLQEVPPQKLWICT